jgi:hypothetical protein
MGWKTTTILIRPARLDSGPDQLLAELGFEKRRKIDDKPFSGAGAGSIWVGSIGDCVILETSFAFILIDDQNEGSPHGVTFKKALFQRFPEAVITAVWAHSVTGGWGYAVYERGVPIRRHLGSEREIYIDEGPRLPIEKELIAKYEKIEQDGVVSYRDPDCPECDDMLEGDLGDCITPAVGSFYAGTDIEALNAAGANFWVNDEEEQFHAAQALAQTKARKRPWWAFWK